MHHRERSATEMLLLGASLPLGWSLLDAALWLQALESSEFLRFVPGILVACALGAVAGLAARSWRLLGLMILVALAGVGMALQFADQLPRHERWLPITVLALLLGIGAGSWSCARLGIGYLRMGLTLGCLLAAGLTWHQDTKLFRLAVPASLALVALAAGCLPRPAWKHAITALVILGCLGFAGRQLLQAPRIELHAVQMPDAPLAAGPNVILIVLDTVSAKHLKPYGYARQTTPALDRFARDEATIYGNARSTSPFTLASHGSMFTGLFPSEHGATRPFTEARPMRSDVTTLPERFQMAGFQTAAVISNAHYLSPRYGFDRGFEYFDSRRGGAVKQHLALVQYAGVHLQVGHLNYREATRITKEAIQWLKNERDERRFFLMLNYMDAHLPYHPPSPFDQAFSERQPLDALKPEAEHLSLLYDRELLYLDSQLERLFQSLKQQGLFDNSAIIVTSDHGEALGGHGLPDHCWMLYDDVVHVPLYVKPAGGRSIGRNDVPISGAEIFDLSLELAGLEPGPFERSAGMIGEWHPWKDFEPITRRWAKRLNFDPERSLIAWREADIKYIVSSDGSVEAYDLKLDPEELNPLELNPPRQEAARKWAMDWWAEHKAPESQAIELDEDDQDMLRALGYGG